MKKQAGYFLTILYMCILLLKITGIKNNCTIITASFVAAEMVLLEKFNFPIFFFYCANYIFSLNYIRLTLVFLYKKKER